jgi:hypothetical protein
MWSVEVQTFGWEHPHFYPDHRRAPSTITKQWLSSTRITGLTTKRPDNISTSPRISNIFISKTDY